MALKSFSRLSPRNKGSIVGQIHKLMKFYGDFFCVRDRTYLRDLADIDGVFYWMVEEANNLISLAILEPAHIFNLEGFKLQSLGYLISRKTGYMDRVLQHIWSDFEQENLILFSKPNLANKIPLKNLQLIEFTPEKLETYLPELANHKTTYFNIEETIFEGLKRREYNVYLKITPELYQKLFKRNPEFKNLFKHFDPDFDPDEEEKA